MVNILLTITASLTLMLAILTVINGQKKALNIVLFFFSISIFLWLVFSLLTNLSSNPDIALHFARLSLVGPLLSSFFFSVFIKLFLSDKRREISYWVRLSLPMVPVLLLTPTKLNISSIDSYGANTQVGLLYLLAIPIIAIYSFSGVLELVKYFRHTKDKALRSQIFYIIVGINLTIIPGIIVNGLLPIIGWNEAYLYGPNFAIFMVLFFSVSILKHGLLNIRFIAVRALTYVGLLASLTAIYVILADYVARKLFDNEQFPQLVLQVSAVIILVFIFEPLRKLLDNLTRNVFFQDNYDPQSFIEDVNKILVDNLEVETLLNKIVNTIENNLKSDFCSFYIRDTSYYKSRTIGDGQSGFNEKESNKLKELLPKIRKKTISIYDSSATKEEAEVVDIMKNANAEVLVRLVSTLEYEVHGVGYLFIGPKKTGKLYNDQDLKILEIISNELVIAVQNALRFEEIEQFNVTLQKKIDDATKELKASNDKLKALDEAKDEFVSMASHQLRTPLTSIKGYVSMVLEEDAGKINEQQKQMLGQAMFSSQRMVYLISDLLNVSRLKTGKFIIESKPVYLPDLVESEMSQLYDGAAAKNITLSFDKPKSFSTLSLDDIKLRQVVMNFTDNAIYYTQSGGKINVSLKDKKDSVEFTVEDNGMGVPKAEQHKLFAKFYRADNARKARPDGTGLGLFMAKKVIVAQGGSLIFDSKEGKGSTFGFSFPKEKLEITTTEG